MNQTFKQYLVEARYGVRAELKPRTLMGSYTAYDENGRRGYADLQRGRFPVIRLFSSQYTELKLFILVSSAHWVLHNPKPIIVNVIGGITTRGKRLSQIEILEGLDQLVSYWTVKPYKGYKKRYKVYREDPNFETGYEGTLSARVGSKILFAMTKDLKRV